MNVLTSFEKFTYRLQYQSEGGWMDCCGAQSCKSSNLKFIQNELKERKHACSNKEFQFRIVKRTETVHEEII